MIEGVLFMLGLYILAVVFHELGHLMYVKLGLRTPGRIIFDGKLRTEFEYDTLDKKQNVMLLENGIFGGGVPILLSLIFMPDFWLSNLAALIPYVIGCKKDLIELRNLLN